MYIPTQEERYSKGAALTLLLCVIIPPAVILYLKGVHDVLQLVGAFTLPIAFLFQNLGLGAGGAVALSAAIQALAFFLLARRSRRSPKTKLTIGITWGMMTALSLKIILVYAEYALSLGI